MKRSRPYTECIDSFKRDHFDTMDSSSPTDKGSRTERDRSRRDEEVKMRSLNRLGSDRDDFGRNHARNNHGQDRNVLDKGSGKALTNKSSASRTSSFIDKDGSDRGEAPRNSWRKSYAVERENGDGVKESLEKVDGPRTPLRKGSGHERDGAESSKYHAMSLGSEKGGTERGEGAKASWRISSERGEVGRSSKRGFGTEEIMAKSGRNSPDSSDRATARASRKGFELDNLKTERGEDFRDMSRKLSPAAERDGHDKGESGKSPRDKVSGTDSYGKESSKFSPRSGRVWDRDGSEPPRFSPRKGFGLEKEGSELLKFSPRKGFGAETDSMDSREMAKASPKEKDRLHRDVEKRWSPGKGHRFSPDEADRRSWHRSFSAKSFNGWDHDGQREWEGHKSHGRFSEREDRRKKVSESLSIRWDDREGQEGRIHIAKGLRSERERHRREEVTKSQQYKEAPQEGECEDGSDGKGVAKVTPSERSPSEVCLGEGGSATKHSLNDVNTESEDGCKEGVQTASADSDENLTEQDAKQDKVEEVQMPDPLSGSEEKSEMEEGELDPEEEVVDDAQKMDETAEDEKEKAFGISSIAEEIDRGEHHVNEMDAGQLEVNKGLQTNSKVEEDDEGEGPVTEMDSQSVRQKATAEGLTQEVVEETAVLLQEGQSAVGGGESHLEFGQESEQPHYMETEEVSLREEEATKLDLTGKETKLEMAKDIDMEGHRNLTLDLLSEQGSRGTCQQERVADLNLHWNVADQDTQRGSCNVDDLGKGLTLSLSPNLETARLKERKILRADTGGEVNTIEKLERMEERQRGNKSKEPMMEKVTAEFEEVVELSCENQKQKRLKLGPLELSLGLPDTSLKLAFPTPGPVQLPVSSELDRRSLQSLAQTRTNSDGFTTSLSFSQSRSFVHNPSCSLTRTSFENQEYSCGSQQISQGNEHMSHGSLQVRSGNDQVSNGKNHGLSGLSQDRLKRCGEVPIYPRLRHDGNVQNNQGFPGVSRSNKGLSLNEKGYERVGSDQVSQGSHQIAQRLNTAQKYPITSLRGNGHEKKVILLKDAQDRLQKEVQLSPAQSVGSWDTRSEQHKQLQRLAADREQCAPPAQKVHIKRGEDVTGEGSLTNEKIGLLEIVTEPVAVMAGKLQVLSDSFLEGLRDLVKDMLCSFEKREEFMNLQKIIQRRTDLTQETLLRAHRTQLEILLALKTGMQSFVQPDSGSLTYKALIEIFLQTRCRNFDCQTPLPGEGCDCRICSQKSGFCNVCMCIVCSKFDFDANTCRWVGCDYCMHWCHTDCGIRMSYIEPGPSIRQSAGTSEMQFRCIACDHSSELSGFVKEVFTTCAMQWNAETLAKELDCVRSIFHGSKDMQGKQLCWKAEQMLQKLENKVDAAVVCRIMLRFFTEGNVELEGTSGSAAKPSFPSKPQEACDRVADAVQAMFKVSSNANSKLPGLDRAWASLQTYDRELEGKRKETAELQYGRVRKKAAYEELESAVRVKQAEAKMFQLHADEARQEADCLKCIAMAKCEKIEEEYASKYAKLRLNEAQERRRRQLEELQVLERSQHDFQQMKARMQMEIKDLLTKMETAKWQLS